MKNKIEEIVDEFLQDSLCNIDYEHEYIQAQRDLMIDKLEEEYSMLKDVILNLHKQGYVQPKSVESDKDRYVYSQFISTVQILQK
jgi:hypothetical protein